jgi:DNA-binding SARP family transcriptional activator
MSQLRLITLGRFEANTALGEALLLPTRKAEVLLAYLALTLGQSQPRDRLQNLLWSDRSEEQARNSLRQTLSALKKATQNIDPPPLIIDRSSIAVTPGTIEIDVLELEHLAGIAVPIPSPQRRACTAVIFSRVSQYATATAKTGWPRSETVTAA